MKLPIAHKEILAAVCAVQMFKDYLHFRPFLIITDNISVKLALSTTNTHLKRCKLQKYAIKLAELQYKIVYRKGIDHKLQDSLSRAEYPPMEEDDSEMDQLHNCEVFSAQPCSIEDTPSYKKTYPTHNLNFTVD